MRRRAISVGSLLIAAAALVVVLVNATLVDRRGPYVARVSLSAPVEGRPEIALTLTAIDLQFSEPVRPASVERRFRIVPYVAGSISWDGSTATFTPSEKLPADTEFTVSVRPGFQDLAGNVADAGLDAFTFRTVGPPTVVETTPEDGADGVPVDGVVTITFDRLMDTSAVEAALEVDPVAPVRPAWSGRALTLAFDAPLEFGTTYTVRIGTGAADTDGSRLRTRFTTSFTTVAAGLRVVETVPSDGVAGISVRTPIAVAFDGPIDPATVAGALTVTPPIGGDVRVVAVPDDRSVSAGGGAPPGTVLLFQPSELLAAHTTYSVRLDPVVARDGTPDQVATGRSWSFTTGQPTPSGHNHLAWLSARGGVANVWLMNPDGSAPRQLTTGLAPVSGFDVTADGQRVAFAAGGVVRTMRIDGADERVVTGSGRLEYAPRFTPDGRRLLVGRRGLDGEDAGWWLVPLEPGAGGERQVLVAGAPPPGSTDLDGVAAAVGEGGTPWSSRAAWDPTGRWLALTDGAGAVHVIDVEAPDAEAAAVGTGLTTSSAAAWDARSGRFLVAAALRGGQEARWSIRTDGQVDQDGEGVGSVAVAPDGAIALLLPSSGGVVHLAVVRGDDRRPRPLTRGDELADRSPSFSPDGRTILFGRVRADAPSTSAGIWTVDATGGSAIPLTTDGAYPRWLP